MRRETESEINPLSTSALGYKRDIKKGGSRWALGLFVALLVSVSCLCFVIVVGESDVLVPIGILPGRRRFYGNAAANCFQLIPSSSERLCSKNRLGRHIIKLTFLCWSCRALNVLELPRPECVRSHGFGPAAKRSPCFFTSHQLSTILLTLSLKGQTTNQGAAISIRLKDTTPPLDLSHLLHPPV